jgi:hypothetical protein
MLQTFDLAALAETLADPFRPLRLVSLGGLDVGLMIAEGPASWFRQVTHDELLLVLEGVVTLDGPQGKVVVNEGEVATAERNARHHVHSGMRSTVLLIEEVKAAEQGNGHLTPDVGLAGQVEKRNVGVQVLEAGAFNWLRAGAAGGYAAHATRVVGASAPYTAPAGGVLMVVYRGVLDYHADAASGVLVGSQMLAAGAGTQLALRSERGATVVLATQRGAGLPQVAAAAPDAADDAPSRRPAP